MKNKQLKTMDNVIDEMSELFFSLKNDETSIRKSKEMANIAGKIISANGVKILMKTLSVKEKAIDKKIKIINP